MALINDYHIHYFRLYLLLIYHYTLSVPGYGNTLFTRHVIRLVSHFYIYIVSGAINTLKYVLLTIFGNSTIADIYYRLAIIGLKHENSNKNNQLFPD